MAANKEFNEEKAAEAEKDPRKGLPENVIVEEASAPTELAPADPLAKGPWIQYDGIGTVRYLDEAAWKEAGIDSDKYVEWNYLNNKRIPVKNFTDEELQYLLRCDGRFSLVEA